MTFMTRENESSGAVTPEASQVDPKITKAVGDSVEHYRSKNWTPEAKKYLIEKVSHLMLIANELCRGKWPEARPDTILTRIGMFLSDSQDEKTDYRILPFRLIATSLTGAGLRRTEAVKTTEEVFCMALICRATGKTPKEILQDREKARIKVSSLPQGTNGQRHNVRTFNHVV